MAKEAGESKRAKENAIETTRCRRCGKPVEWDRFTNSYRIMLRAIFPNLDPDEPRDGPFCLECKEMYQMFLNGGYVVPRLPKDPLDAKIK